MSTARADSQGVVAARSPAITASPYRAPWWLPGGDLQTIYAALFLQGPPVVYRRERWQWPDGDFVDADWSDTADERAPIVVLFHGLEGSSQSHYARHLMHALRRLGWRGVVPHFRGCSGEPNHLPRAYFAGDVAEIDAMLNRVRACFPGAPLYAVGASLGGNALLKWLGEQGRAAGTLLQAAAAISAPLDMNAAGRALDKGFNRLIYTRRFLTTLKPKSLAKAARFPGVLDSSAIAACATFAEFDTVVTARLHGYQDAADYWTRTSSKPGLKNITLPTLLLNARNDPFLPAYALPTKADISSAVTLEQPAQGGHVAFPCAPFPGRNDWLSARILAFFQTRPAIVEAPQSGAQSIDNM